MACRGTSYSLFLENLHLQIERWEYIQALYRAARCIYLLDIGGMVVVMEMVGGYGG